MDAESVAPTLRTNVEQCIYCVHFEALGCAGSARFCMYHNAFLMHDPACKEACSHRQGVEDSD